MRLGRKLAEGFAVDHEADQARSDRPAPAAERFAVVDEVPDVIHTARTEPAHSGPRAGD